MPLWYTKDDLKIKESFEGKMWEKIIFIKSYMVQQIYNSQIFDTNANSRVSQKLPYIWCLEEISCAG